MNTRLHSRIESLNFTNKEFFITKQANKNDCIEKETIREKRKLSKLSYASNNDKTIALQNNNQMKQKTKRKSKTEKVSKCSVPPKKQKVNKNK